MNNTFSEALRRLEVLTGRTRVADSTDLASLSDEEIRRRLREAVTRVRFAQPIRTTPLPGRGPMDHLSDAEVVRRLRRAQQRLSARKLVEVGVPVGSALALTAPGPLPRASGVPEGEQSDPESDRRPEPEPPRREPPRKAPSGLLAHLDEEGA
jgi:LmbE family N-acetylglucosaminyl deacetylase